MRKYKLVSGVHTTKEKFEMRVWRKLGEGIHMVFLMSSFLKKLRFQNSTLKRKAVVFKFLPLEERFSKSSVFVTD